MEAERLLPVAGSVAVVSTKGSLVVDSSSAGVAGSVGAVVVAATVVVVASVVVVVGATVVVASVVVVGAMVEVVVGADVVGAVYGVVPTRFGERSGERSSFEADEASRTCARSRWSRVAGRGWCRWTRWSC